MRKFLCLSFFLFSLSHAFAGFNDGEISKFVEMQLASTTSRGIELYNNTDALLGGLDSYWLDALGGFQFYEDSFDFTVSGEVWFPFANWSFETARIALGCGTLYHFQRYKDISSEHDLLFDTNFRYQSKSGTTITFRGGYAEKITHLDALSELGGVSLIYDDYPEAGFLVDKIWANGLELYFEHSLHDLFRYPLFCSPHYLFGAAFNTDFGLRFSGDISMRIVDGYAASPYVDSLILKFGVRYSF